MIKDMVKLAIVAIMFVVLFMYPFALFWRGLVYMAGGSFWMGI